MTVERINVLGADGRVDRDSWLSLRKRDVTASTVGALFGVHPYTTAAELYAEKTGVEFEQKTNVRMRRGSRLERAVAEEVAEKRPDWKISPAGVYLRDPDLRLGATPDFVIEGDPRGVGILQTKVTTLRAFKREWQKRGDQNVDEIVPPFWIGLQTLTEMMLFGAAWGAAAVYIDDPWNDDCHICEIARHAGAEQRIRDATEKFWMDVEFGVEPAIDYARDGELISALYPEAVPLKSIDLTGDNMLPVILAERDRLKDQISDAQARCIEIDNEIRAKMGDAEIATIDGWTVTNKTFTRTIKPQPFERETTFRKLHITDTRPKQEDAADGPF
ncbi:YqaJ viral recombinase family nuclease [Bradyrhizobium sp. USDA 4350]